MDTVLTCHNIAVSFGELKALSGVSFEVERNTVLGITGPNGAGKTTLLNVISGSIKPTRGNVVMDGVDITGMKPNDVCHKGLARTFQIPVVFSSLSVSENVRVGTTFGKSKDQQTSEQILEQVGLRSKATSLSSDIDLYSKKLLMLAAALATNPKLIFLDEPLGGLNIQEIDAFLETIRKLMTERGITILIIEHIFDKLVEISDKMMILDHGKQIYLGEPETAGNDPKVIEVYLGITKHA